MLSSEISSVHIIALAKINLCLHITGRAPDQRHLLEGRTAFAAYGDGIEVKRSRNADRAFTLEICGEYAKDCPNSEENLIYKAFTFLQNLEPKKFNTPITVKLIKNLPVASGVGGGSSDAAAFLLACVRLFALPLSQETLFSVAKKLGADVPMCLYRKPCHIFEAGEVTRPALNGGLYSAILVNPNLPLSTAQVFQAYRERAAAFSPSGAYDENDPFSGGNDLQTVATEIIPKIGEIIETLYQFSEVTRLLKVGMSGSGATCFAIYRNEAAASFVYNRLKKNNPEYFIKKTFFHV